MAIEGMKAKGLEAVSAQVVAGSCVSVKPSLLDVTVKARISSTNQPATRRHSHDYMEEAETEEQWMKDDAKRRFSTDNSSSEDESIMKASKRSRREPKEDISADGKMPPSFNLWEPEASLNRHSTAKDAFAMILTQYQMDHFARGDFCRKWKRESVEEHEEMHEEPHIKHWVHVKHRPYAHPRERLSRVPGKPAKGPGRHIRHSLPQRPEEVGSRG